MEKPSHSDWAAPPDFLENQRQSIQFFFEFGISRELEIFGPQHSIGKENFSGSKIEHRLNSDLSSQNFVSVARIFQSNILHGKSLRNDPSSVSALARSWQRDSEKLVKKRKALPSFPSYTNQEFKYRWRAAPLSSRQLTLDEVQKPYLTHSPAFSASNDIENKKLINKLSRTQSSASEQRATLFNLNSMQSPWPRFESLFEEALQKSSAQIELNQASFLKNGQNSPSTFKPSLSLKSRLPRHRSRPTGSLLHGGALRLNEISKDIFAQSIEIRKKKSRKPYGFQLVMFTGRSSSHSQNFSSFGENQNQKMNPLRLNLTEQTEGSKDVSFFPLSAEFNTLRESPDRKSLSLGIYIKWASQTELSRSRSLIESPVRSLESQSNSNSPMKFSLSDEKRSPLLVQGKKAYESTDERLKLRHNLMRGVGFQNTWVYLGEIPLLTNRGSFLVNGTTKVLVNQITRCPNCYFKLKLDSQNRRSYQASFLSDYGSWLRFETDRHFERIWVRIDKSSRFPLEIFLQSLCGDFKSQNRHKPLFFGQSSSKKRVTKKIYPLYESSFVSGSSTLALESIWSFGRKSGLKKKLKTLPDSKSYSNLQTKNSIRLKKPKLSESSLHKTRLRSENVLASSSSKLRTVGVQAIWKKCNPGRFSAAEGSQAQARWYEFFGNKFFNPKKYSLSIEGRKRLNRRLGRLPMDDSLIPTLTPEDVLSALEILTGLAHSRGQSEFLTEASAEPKTLGLFDKGYSGAGMDSAEISLGKQNCCYLDDIDHFQNRRVRLPGSILLNQFRLALSRAFKNRSPMSSGVSKSVSTREFQSQPNQIHNPVFPSSQAFARTLRELFGTSQLSQYMDETNPLAEITHKRRLTSLGPGGVGRESAGFAVREIHPSHFGRICPIETPEGQNAGLVGSLAMYAAIDSDGKILTPVTPVLSPLDFESRLIDIRGKERSFARDFGLSREGQSRNIYFLNAESFDSTRVCGADSGQAIESLIANEYIRTPSLSLEKREELLINLNNTQLTEVAQIKQEFKKLPALNIEFRGICCVQMISVATSLIPFLEHDDANRALMGSNMQRQAVPLLRPTKALVGTGYELQAARDASYIQLAQSAGQITRLDSVGIRISSALFDENSKKRQDFFQFHSSQGFSHTKAKEISRRTDIDLLFSQNISSNQGTYISERPPSFLHEGDCIEKGDLLADNASTHDGELALGKNLLTGYLAWEGYNFEDAIVISERLVTNDLYTSVHISCYEFDSRNLLPLRSVFHSSARGKTPLFELSESSPFQRQSADTNSRGKDRSLEASPESTTEGIFQASNLDQASQPVFKSKTSRGSNSAAASTRTRTQLFLKEYCYGTESFLKPWSNFRNKDPIQYRNFVENKDSFSAPLPWESVEKETKTSGVSESFEAQASGFRSESWQSAQGLLKEDKINLLDTDGIIKIGSWVQPGGILIQKLKFTQQTRMAIQNWLRKFNQFKAERRKRIDYSGVGYSQSSNDVNNRSENLSVFNDFPRPINESTKASTRRDSRGLSRKSRKVDRRIRAEYALLRAILARRTDLLRGYSPLSRNFANSGLETSTETDQASSFESEFTEDEIIYTQMISQLQEILQNNSQNTSVQAGGDFWGRVFKRKIPWLSSTSRSHPSPQTSAGLQKRNQAKSESAESDGSQERTNQFKGILIAAEEKAQSFSHSQRPSLSPGDADGENPNRELSFANLSAQSQTKSSQETKKAPLQIYVAHTKRIQIGDKMSGRHGNKGIVSLILPPQDMPYIQDGRPLDIVLNPLGVPSRMNVGQVLETLLGLASEYSGWIYRVIPFVPQSFDMQTLKKETASQSMSQRQSSLSYGLKPETARSLVYSRLWETSQLTGLLWLFDPNNPGKQHIFDGRTGDLFDQPVLVGYSYIFKLNHLVDDKIHARSVGPYSAVTQQPLGGRSKLGGQRLGEMEVWACEGFGASYLLQEFLTTKSDSIELRNNFLLQLIRRNHSGYGQGPKTRSRIESSQRLPIRSVAGPILKFSHPDGLSRPSRGFYGLPSASVDFRVSASLQASLRIQSQSSYDNYPESFRVLVAELQALCLNLYSNPDFRLSYPSLTEAQAE